MRGLAGIFSFFLNVPKEFFTISSGVASGWHSFCFKESVKPDICQQEVVEKMFSIGCVESLVSRSKFCVLYGFLIALLFTSLAGCVHTRTTTEREILTQGALPAPTAPAFVGELAKKGEFVASGTFNQSWAPDAQRNDRAGGASGNIIVERQMLGTIGVGVSDAVELSAMGRYANTSWGAKAQALDTSAQDLPGAVVAGIGLGTRVNFVRTERFSLHLGASFEILSVPYQRAVTGRTRTDYRESDWVLNEETQAYERMGEAWEKGETTSLTPRTARGSASKLTGRIGLGGAYTFTSFTLLGGVELQLVPTINAHQFAVTTCESFHPCEGPTDLDEIPVFSRSQTLATGYAGVQYYFHDNFSLIGLVHTALDGEEQHGQSAPGFSLSIKLHL